MFLRVCGDFESTTAVLLYDPTHFVHLFCFVFRQNEASAIVTWTSTGTAFGILDNAAFGQDVLSSYFKRESAGILVPGCVSCGCCVAPCETHDKPRLHPND